MPNNNAKNKLNGRARRKLKIRREMEVLKLAGHESEAQSPSTVAMGGTAIQQGELPVLQSPHADSGNEAAAVSAGLADTAGNAPAPTSDSPQPSATTDSSSPSQSSALADVGSGSLSPNTPEAGIEIWDGDSFNPVSGPTVHDVNSAMADGAQGDLADANGFELVDCDDVPPLAAPAAVVGNLTDDSTTNNAQGLAGFMDI